MPHPTRYSNSIGASLNFEVTISLRSIEDREESAGASFLRRDGTVWTTDKGGIIMGLLAAEMLARTGKDPGEIYRASPTGSARRFTNASTRPPPRSRRPYWSGSRPSR
jgi:hypothetical protein